MFFLLTCRRSRRGLRSGRAATGASGAMPLRRRERQIAALLKSASRAGELLQIHAAMLKCSLFPHHAFPTARLLASPRAPLRYALSLFAAIPSPTLFHHTTLLRAISASPSAESLAASLPVFASARARLPELDEFAFQPLLALCAKRHDAAAASLGRQLHALVVLYGFSGVVSLGNALCHFYCSCCGGSDAGMADARRMFDEMPERDDVSWNTVIGGHVRMGEVMEAVQMFSEMRRYGVDVSVTALIAIVGCCWQAETLHGFCFKVGFCINAKVAAAMVRMYVRDNSFVCARKVFNEVTKRDTILYNCMVDGYAKAGQFEEAMDLVDRMRQEGVRPSSGTLVGVLSACGASGAISIGRRLHDIALEAGIELDTALGTALMDMYFKCGYPSEAVAVFNMMQDRDVKAWTAMIMGSGVNGRASEVVSLFCAMGEDGVVPNEVTFLAVLNACSHGGLVSEGKKFMESMVLQYGLSPSTEHYGCIIDLLGRAGRLDEAYELIGRLSSQGDATAWRALLAACRVHGNVKLGKMVQTQLDNMGNYHPSDAILLSNTYALESRWDEIARVRDSEEKKIVKDKKEPGCSSIEVL
ncbi:pentatricopeptide repeat-containing protein At1g26900, mitochondrial [Oryza brachyantha]|uniref:pentatricopeptide repeat-containing protein At1g26900, mitochondrial n=1 Tax=Oryza brachyantha TaxID=4533 RepID=UPI001ADB6E55|nr:pentatricopeptide repeat-containing protein At1g26900, mitochondrial [Oryza brachyantha]